MAAQSGSLGLAPNHFPAQGNNHKQNQHTRNRSSTLTIKFQYHHRRFRSEDVKASSLFMPSLAATFPALPPAIPSPVVEMQDSKIPPPVHAENHEESPAAKMGISESNYDMWYRSSLTRMDGNLYLGNVAASLDPEVLSEYGITALVSLLNNPEPIWAGWDAPKNRMLVPRGRHLFVYTPDEQDFDILHFMPDILTFIDKQLEMPANPAEAYGGIWGNWDMAMNAPTGWMEKTFPLTNQTKTSAVLVHCKAGMSRSATVIVAWFMKKEGLTAEAAIRKVQGMRPIANPNPNFRTALKVWEDCGCELWEDTERKVRKKPYAKYLAALGQGNEEYEIWRSAWEDK